MTPETPFPSQTLLELHVKDFEPIKDYYQKLGFSVEWLREPEGFKGYMIVRLDQNVLCFWGGNQQVYEQDYFKQFPKDSPRGYGVEIVLMVEDIDKYYEKVKDVANVFEDLRDRPWGLRDFRCVDPAGFYLRFTTKHDILNDQYAVK